MIEAEDTWNSMASDYEGFTDKPDSYSNLIEWTCIKELLPELENRRVIDVGCGSGRFSFYLENYRPKEIIGTDISQEMLNLAKEKQKRNSKVKFIKCSVDELGKRISKKVDIVFSSTASHYFPNLKTAFSNIYNVLSNDGVFILSAMHPIYTASYPLKKDGEWTLRYLNREVREYIQPWTRFGKSRNEVTCKSFQYTISDYLKNLIDVGFTIINIEEPEPPEEWKETNLERYESIINEPLYLIIKCKK